MTRFTGPRMAIPTFKTPVETIASPRSEILFHFGVPAHSRLRLFKGTKGKEWNILAR